MTDAERQELYTLMQQWSRNDDILYQKVREWIESREAATRAAAQQELNALRARLSDLAVEMKKHSNDHIHDEDTAKCLGAAVEGVCVDRIRAVLAGGTLRNDADMGTHADQS